VSDIESYGNMVTKARFIMNSPVRTQMVGETKDMSIVDEALHVMNVGALPLLRTTAPTI
jgi:hypothetical protein